MLYRIEVSNPFRAGGEALPSGGILFGPFGPLFQTPSERAVRRCPPSTRMEFHSLSVSNPFRAGGEALAPADGIMSSNQARFKPLQSGR